MRTGGDRYQAINMIVVLTDMVHMPPILITVLIA